MLDQLEKTLTNKGVFEDNIPTILKEIANALPSTNIPYKMKLTFAVSELMLFVSQFRRNITHWDGVSSIPINAVTFCIAKSGASKDSSAKAARKCFTTGYNRIDSYRKQIAVKQAIEKAQEVFPDGDCTLFAVYKEFLIPPNPLFVAPSTPEGFIQHLNDLEESGIGAGYMFSGEVGAELSNNSTLIENLKAISEMYDEGNKEVKVLKDRNNQSKEVKGLPVSALFLGSQDNLLYNEAIKAIFRREFTTKLARRSFFSFANDTIDTDSFTSIEAMIKAEREIEDKAKESREKILKYIDELTTWFFKEDKINTPITVEEGARDLFILYKRYNEELANTIDSQYPITKLTRNHLQWKAFKLAGALTVIDGRDSIEYEDYVGAISFVELINKDILSFERELVKEPYETFAEYCKENAKNNSLFISLHSLRKMGHIPMKGSPTTKMKELVQLVSSYDDSGVYQYMHEGEEGILYSKYDKTDKILISYLFVNGNKNYRAKHCDKGYVTEEMLFTDLEKVLQEDLAYTPFRFRDGKRGTDNIDSGCKWIVMDIDDSVMTDKDAHLLLSDINHFIVRSSDPNNEFKFRILMELDANIDVPNGKWIKFIQLIAKDLGLTADRIAKAGICFSYAESAKHMLSVTDGSPLEVKPYLEAALKEDPKAHKIPNSKEKSAMLDSPTDTFYAAYNAKKGERSRKLIWAAKYARELGASKEYVINLMHDIHDNYWVNPLEGDRFEYTIIRQINRWEF